MSVRAVLLGALLVAGAAGAEPRGLADAPIDGDVLDAAFVPRRVALVIGVDRYDDDTFPTLRYAASDAHEIGELLEEPMWGGFDDVVVLTGREHTSRVAILAAVDEIVSTLQRNDTFLLYFSGHGTLSTDDSGQTSLYICPRDTVAERPESSGLRVDTLQRIFKSRVKARRKVLILDSCHNGEAKSFLDEQTRERMNQRRSPMDPLILTRMGEAEAHLFAAAFHQPALEDPDLEHGVYTYFLLQAQGRRSGDSDLNRDGVVTVVEAHQYARDHTISHTGGAQVPQAMFKEVGRQDIYLSGGEDAFLAAERGLLTSYSRLLANCHISVDGVPRGMLPRALPVDPGMHRIEVVEPNTGRVLVQRSVRVRAGQSLSVDALADERRPEGRGSLALGGSFFGVVGPYAASYPSFSAGPDLSLRWRLRGPARNVRLVANLSYSHGEGGYGASYDEPIQANMVRVGGSVQACADTRRTSLWIGPRFHAVGVWVRLDEPGAEQQYALMPSGGLTLGFDTWVPGHVGIQFAAFADVFAPVVRDHLDNPETRMGVLIGGQIRFLGSIR